MTLHHIIWGITTASWAVYSLRRWNSYWVAIIGYIILEVAHQLILRMTYR